MKQIVIVSKLPGSRLVVVSRLPISYWPILVNLRGAKLRIKSIYMDKV